MASGGKAAAVGAVAATAVIGGKGMLEVAPTLFTQSAHVAEISVSKATIVAEGAGFGDGLNGIRSGYNKLTPSINSGLGKVPPRFDASGPLSTTFRVGRLADADVNPSAPFNNSVAPVAPRPFIVLNNQDLNLSGVSSYFSVAQPKLTYDITALTPPLSRAAVEGVVQADLKYIAAKSTENSDAKVTFEVVSGKLTIGSSTTLGGIKITGGEINVYAVSTAVSGAVMTCNAMSDATFKNCVDAAIKQAISSFVKESKLHDAARISD